MSGEMKRRILMTIMGVSICGFSVGLFSFSDLGVDPFQVLAQGSWHLTKLGYGTYYTILNLVMLVIIFIADRKKIGLGTVINLFGVGYIAEFSEYVIRSLVHTDAFYIKVCFLLAGIVIMCLASAVYFTSDLGVSTYDAVALIISEHTKFRFKYVRITTDLVCVITGWVLLDLSRLSSFPKGEGVFEVIKWSFGGIVGIGTIITAFFMGPLISFFNEKVAIPMRYGKGGKKN